MQTCPCSIETHARVHALLCAFSTRLPLLHRIYTRFGSVDALLRGNANQYRELAFKAEVHALVQDSQAAVAIKRAASELEEWADAASEDQITFVCRLHPYYPQLLGEIAQPPIALYVRGNPEALSYEASSIAIVGTRNPSPYGRAATQELSRHAALRGWTVVSGLAFGVDSLAHAEAVGLQQHTIAVLGGGCDRASIAPRRHARLAQDIVESGGVVVSEYPPGTESRPAFFPERNRIIAGIPLVTLVIEAAERSGSLITARFALDENRDVWSLPGEIFNSKAFGTNALIERGALPITSVEQFCALLDELQTPVFARTESDSAGAPQPPPSSIGQLGGQILAFLGHQTAAATLDQITTELTHHPDSGQTISVPDILSELTMLEVLGAIQLESTGVYRRMI